MRGLHRGASLLWGAFSCLRVRTLPQCVSIKLKKVFRRSLQTTFRVDLQDWVCEPPKVSGRERIKLGGMSVR